MHWFGVFCLTSIANGGYGVQQSSLMHPTVIPKDSKVLEGNVSLFSPYAQNNHLGCNKILSIRDPLF